MAKWLLVDGYNLAYRAFHAIPDLTRKDGFPTNALHGWVKTLWRLMDQERPEACVVFFDLGGAQDRLALLPDYKAQREEMPEGHEALIVSSDKDFAQIVGERIKILNPPPPGNPKAGWRMMDAAGVQEKFGVPPVQIADLLALVGDTSDNIPGLDGVGPKTAAKWLEAHGSLEGVLAHAAELKPERFREAVAARADDLRRNLKLTTLNTTLPRPVATSEPVRVREVIGFLEEYEMRTAAEEARRRYEQPELF
jgi:DNA polymerase-1